MKNKYNIGDKVWVMNNNSPEQIVITGMVVRNKKVMYTNMMEGEYSTYWHFPFDEESFFPTKEALIASL